MSRHSIVAVVVLSFVLGACAGPGPSDQSEVVVEKPPAAQAEEIRIPPEWVQAESAVPIDVCKIPDGRPASMKTLNPGVVSLGANGMSNVGFPISPDIIPSSGVANLAVIPATFLDLGKNPSDPMSELGPQLEKMNQWSDFWSQGSFRYEFQVVEDWKVIPAQSTDYSIGRESVSGGPARDSSPFVGLANAVVVAAGSEVDWAAAHGMLVYWPPTVEAIESSWGGGGIESISTPAGDRRLFYWGTGRYHNQSSGSLTAELKRGYLWSYWVHEMLHSQGVNGHAPGNGFASGIAQNQYPVPQGDGYRFSGALDAWSLFLLGWIKDEQVLCIDGREPGSESLAMLTPQEIYGGERKIVVIRTGEHDGIVIESRRPVGYSERWALEDSGLFVYSLNLRVMSDRSGEATGLDCGNNPEFDKWAYYLPPNEYSGLNGSCFFSDFIVHEGDYVSHDGVRVELVFSDEDLDYVRIASEPN